MQMLVKEMAHETGRSHYFISAAKKAGMPMHSVEAAKAWLDKHDDFSAYLVWRIGQYVGKHE